jgi:hypothetical protein
MRGDKEMIDKAKQTRVDLVGLNELKEGKNLRERKERKKRKERKYTIKEKNEQ